MTPPIMSMSIKTTEENNDAVVTSPVSKIRNYKILGLALVVTAVIIVGGVLGGIALYHHLQKKEDFMISTKLDNLVLKENLHVDYGKEIIFMSNLHEGDVDGLNALHDYKKGLIAFHDTDTNECYIDIIQETFNEALNKWRQFSTYTRVPLKKNMTVLQPAIDRTVVRTFLGDNVAKHCEDIPTYWIIKKSETESGSLKTISDPDFDTKQNVQGLDRKKRMAASSRDIVCNDETTLWWWPW